MIHGPWRALGHTSTRITVLLVAASAALGAVAGTPPSITGLGTLPIEPEAQTPVNRYSEAAGVSDDGAVVVGMSGCFNNVGIGTRRAFRWTREEGIQSLGWFAGDSASVARAVSGDGRVIVGKSSRWNGYLEQCWRAFRWTSVTGLEELGPDSGCSLRNGTTGEAVSVDGAVIAAPGTGLRISAIAQVGWSRDWNREPGPVAGGPCFARQRCERRRVCDRGRRPAERLRQCVSVDERGWDGRHRHTCGLLFVGGGSEPRWACCRWEQRHAADRLPRVSVDA